ncbi:MAG: asparagine--tRNA ligase [Planctomycetota bacterium]|jgi:asparaginyl-tRNA synthetase|nr:asparagine--tRNA ligase [Planctomycetota bacterium]
MTTTTADSDLPAICRVNQLPAHVGSTVTVQGWLNNRRSSGKLLFLQLRDGSGTVQAVLYKGAVEDSQFKELDALPQESSLEIVGEVKEDARSPGGVELSVTAVRVVGLAEPYPITKGVDTDSTAFLMDHRHLWLRSSRQAATLRIRSRVIKAIRDFFDSDGFTCVDGPIFTPAACEGTSTLFEVDYFGDPAYLTQSSQLYAEAAAMALGKVYTFGPTFRAEKSKTRRHLTEFWMVEPEVAFARLDDVMDLAENFLVSIISETIGDCRADLELLDRDCDKLLKMVRPFPRISYDEAVEMLNDNGHPFEWGNDFGAPDEEVLTKLFDKPLLVHRFPAQVKAFYMKRDPDDDRVALCVDVLAPEGYGEIIGGSERADDLQFLLDQIKAHDLPQEAFEWYLDLRRYGTVPHGGFGLGLERMVAWLCGTHHIRECIPFPRMLHRIYP